MQHATPQGLQEWLSDPARPKPVLLDVREPWEFELCHLDNSLPMPMRSVPARYLELDRNADTVVICHHGARSMQVAMFLEQQGFASVTNLTGGVAAWARDVAPGMPTY